MVEVPINGQIAEVEFLVPYGVKAAELQADVVGFVLGVEKDDKDLKHAPAAWSVINKWGSALMVTEGAEVSTITREQIMRAIGMQGSMALLGELAGLRAKSVDHLSPDRSGGRPAPE